MITKMRKLTALVYHCEYDSFLQRLQELGVVHVELSQDNTTEPTPEMAHYKEEYARVEKANAALLKMLDKDVLPAASSEGAESQLVSYESLAARIDENEKACVKMQQAVKAAAPWGEYDRELIEKIRKEGYELTFWTCDSKRFDTLSTTLATESEAYLFPISSAEGKCYCVLVASKDAQPDMHECQNVNVPDLLISEATATLQKKEKEREQLQAELKRFAEQQLPCLLAYSNMLKGKIQFDEVEQGTLRVADNYLMQLEGWMPVDKQQEVESYLNGSGAYYEIRDPQAGENVPIHLHNNWFTRKFEVLTGMYGMPDYDEWDPTPILAPFFTLFFAICMGDAGYGLIILLYGLLESAGKAKNTPIVGEMLKGCGPLITILGVATLVVGLALGTFFGMDLNTMNFLPQGVHEYYDFVQGNFPGTTYKFQMVAAIIIGVFHICLAMVFKAIIYSKKEGFTSQISQWGWIILIIGSIITGVLYLIGSFDQNVTTMIFIGIGVVSALGIFLFNNVSRFGKNPILAVILNPLAGLYDTYNMVSGLMGDVLSYIRLYALCLAGGMLGLAFNMIGDMCPIYVGIFIYIIGHLLNLLLSAISAFVHPLRLNFVEYFKNLGYDGLGNNYKPFKK